MRINGGVEGRAQGTLGIERGVCVGGSFLHQLTEAHQGQPLRTLTDAGGLKINPNFASCLGK